MRRNALRLLRPTRASLADGAEVLRELAPILGETTIKSIFYDIALLGAGRSINGAIGGACGLVGALVGFNYGDGTGVGGVTGVSISFGD